MILEHQFSVPAPLDEVWKAMLDPERVAPCMPGATLSGVDGDSFRGQVKVKLGPVSLLYKGSGEFKEKDEQAKRLVIEASGKDARGAGTAAATVTVTLTGSGNTTEGAVHTDLNITGRPAQFGRGMISEVAGKLLDSFSQSLAEKLGAGTSEGAGAAGAAAGTASQPEPRATENRQGGAATEKSNRGDTGSSSESAPIDLLDYAGASVIKRMAPLAVGALIVLLLVLRRRRRRNRR
ncbi:MAG: carbon monoxide dehydrogenase [Pseudonocardiaceae bacterium]|nr:carbon monoxide dehydrogenase [Pseudonocardiaceae bacterium]